MARKSISDIREQKNKLIGALRSRVSARFVETYSDVVRNYHKDYRNPKYRKAYEDARKEFQKTDYFKKQTERANRVLETSQRYEGNIRRSEGFKALEKEIKQAHQDFLETKKYRDYGAQDRAAERHNDLVYRKNHDKFSRSDRMSGSYSMTNQAKYARAQRARGLNGG